MADFPTVRAQFSSVAASKAARKRPTTPSFRGTRPPDLDRRDDIEWFVRDDAPALAALAPEWQRLCGHETERRAGPCRPGARMAAACERKSGAIDLHVTTVGSHVVGSLRSRAQTSSDWS